jgi:hypothetical protein
MARLRTIDPGQRQSRPFFPFRACFRTEDSAPAFRSVRQCGDGALRPKPLSSERLLSTRHQRLTPMRRCRLRGAFQAT